MSKQEWTKEPWRISADAGGTHVLSDSTDYPTIATAKRRSIHTPHEQMQANAARIVDCVNACAGIDNPSEYISSLRQENERLRGALAAEPIWIVNSYSELGVMVNGVCYFQYKAGNIVYDNPDSDGETLKIRPLFKREFGESTLPLDLETFRPGKTPSYKMVSTDDSEWWIDMPNPPSDYKPSHKRGPEFLDDIARQALTKEG